MDQPERVLFLTMYAMDRIDSAGSMRAKNIHQALAQFVDVDFIFGERAERKQTIREYLKRGKLQGISGLYVETSVSWCTIEDLQLMAACRRNKIPVITWIMDAYPLFPETMRSLPFYKRLGSSLLWRLSMAAYFRISDAIAVQSESFAKLFRYPSHVRPMILNPAASQNKVLPISSKANALLYTGNASQFRFGVELLIEAMEIARRELPDIQLLLVCPVSGQPPEILYKNRPWIELMSLTTNEIVNLLPRVKALVNPLLDEPYHRLQIPTKVMDYLGYGRPILATNLPEVRSIIEGNHLGYIVQDSVQNLAEGIIQLFSTDLQELNQMGQNALRAVHEKHSWRHRAQQILDTFEEIRQSR